MKRFYKFLSLMILVIVSLTACNNSDEEQEMEYCYRINQFLSDYDFHKAYIESDKILLFNSDDVLFDRITYNEYDESVDIAYIRKEGDNIYFVMYGVLDDESGYVFINSKSNNILDGIAKLERRGGNSYWYSSIN
ncbi:MAG: hypothetical protein ACI4CT_07665 [Lachnospiraceae bacterium]